MSKPKTMYSEKELKPFLKFWKNHSAEFDYGYLSVDEMYEESYITDGSMGYPKGTRVFSFYHDGFYPCMADFIDMFFKVR